MSGDSRRIIGAANPRALAELRAGREIEWSKEADGGEKLIAQLLDMPLRNIVDPKHGSAIYAGVPLHFGAGRNQVTVDPSTDLRRLFETTPRATELMRHDLLSDAALKGDGTSLHQLSAQTADTLTEALRKVSSGSELVASSIQTQRASELSTAERLTELSSATFVEAGKALGHLDRDYLILPPEWLLKLLSDLDFGMHGEFFVDGPTATSPVQGALGDCWLIAAMASVAWTHSQLISERTRRENIVGAVDAGDADLYFELTDQLTIPVLFFTITIPFVFKLWIGERLPQSAGGGAIYARSSVTGENWPAEIEKAVAVWRSGGNADYPRSSDYAHLNGGDPAWAVHILMGGQPWYHWADADDTWSTIRAHCSGQRTSDALVAWTWGSSDDSPNKVDYGDAHIAANHAYSILGTWETNNRQYVILRNPWGWYEATLNTFAGTWATPESWGNANLTLPGNGVFALEIHTFREYFMGFGGAS
jgi:lambda repressor-like predicted transcriptional regulator